MQKYIGSEGERPKLNRLSGGEWQKQKAKVKTSIREMAGELIKLYAHREAVPGHAFDPDTPWQREFEDSFPFEETPDQLRAIQEIKHDMEQPKIMTGSCAATWATAKPRWRCGPYSRPLWAENRRRCWRLPPFWCSSIMPP